MFGRVKYCGEYRCLTERFKYDSPKHNCMVEVERLDLFNQ